MVSSGTIPVREAELEYQLRGSGPAVIVLHGGPGIGYRYLEPELVVLSDLAQLLFYDQRASGMSTGVECTSLLNIHEFVADLEAVRAAHGAQRPIFLGHSFGGLLAMHYAIAYPDRVAALILVDPDPASRTLWSRHSESILARQSQEAAREIATIREIDDWNYSPALVERYFELALAPLFAKGQSPAGFGSRFTQVIPRNLTTTASALRTSLGNWELHPALHTIQCPCLLVVGEESIFPAEASDRLATGLPDCTVARVKHASHFPQLEAPREFQQAVRSFLSRPLM